MGGLKLMVPKDREGEFQTELLERYQRSEKALVLAMCGIDERGYLEVLGCWVAESESEAS